MEKFQEIIKFLTSGKNPITVLLFVVLILGTFMAFKSQILPKWTSYQNLKSDIAEQTSRYDELVKKQAARKLEEEKNKIKIGKVPVTIYKNTQTGLPAESASIDFVTTVIGMLEKTHNTVMDISYKVDGLTSVEKDSLPASVSVVQLVMTLNSDYMSFQNFVNTLYGYDYLATIKTIKVVPLKENKNMLEINLVIWLYVSK